MRQKQPIAPAPTTRRHAKGSGGQNRTTSRADVSLRSPTYTTQWPVAYHLTQSDGTRAEFADGDLTPDELEMARAQMARERLCVTKADAAKMLSVSVSTINKLIGRGELPVMKIGTAARIRTKDIIEYVNGWAS